MSLARATELGWAHDPNKANEKHFWDFFWNSWKRTILSLMVLSQWNVSLEAILPWGLESLPENEANAEENIEGFYIQRVSLWIQPEVFSYAGQCISFWFNKIGSFQFLLLTIQQFLINTPIFHNNKELFWGLSVGKDWEGLWHTPRPLRSLQLGKTRLDSMLQEN